MTLDLADVEMGKIDEYSIYTAPCLNNTETYQKQPSKIYLSTKYIRYNKYERAFYFGFKCITDLSKMMWKHTC